ncbi:NAD(P)/FAD-dependent oxidoreductase [Pyxidicoccus trucidator]|uniref:NAD(P)/FAD-dependent oxidoreductase n=1 Tax=Pyxidicoccus trucidator TaxID=2709662 RepID=UPI0013DC5DCD|nr:FAD-dependent oxidoreductase [Pyxidicoccus trucidator]
MVDDLNPDVLVVGGGLIGLATAATLLERAPGTSVTVLERDVIGRGASRHSGAIDIPYFRTALHRQLVETSWAWHEARGAQATAYRRQVPMTWYVDPGADLQSHVATPLARGAPGAPPGWRSPDGVRELVGDAFVIDPEAWCHVLAQEVTRSGRGQVVEHTTAVALDERPRGATVTCADGRSYSAGHVVLTLGPWFPGWSERTREWSAARGLRTKRVFGLNIEVDASLRANAAVGWPGADIYFHPAHAGGGYRLSLRHDEWDVAPDAPHAMADIVLERASGFLDPLLGKGHWSVSGHRVFVDTYTPEFEPVIAPCMALGGRVTLATGTHGSGIRLAPGIAELTARTVLSSLEQTRGVA